MRRVVLAMSEALDAADDVFLTGAEGAYRRIFGWTGAPLAGVFAVLYLTAFGLRGWLEPEASWPALAAVVLAGLAAAVCLLAAERWIPPREWNLHVRAYRRMSWRRGAYPSFAVGCLAWAMHAAYAGRLWEVPTDAVLPLVLYLALVTRHGAPPSAVPVREAAVAADDPVDAAAGRAGPAAADVVLVRRSG